MSIMLKLQRSEQEALERCEKVIEAGITSFVDVGNALIEVNEKKLYREQFDTFKEYAQTKWSMGRGHAYRLMDAAKVVSNLSPMGDKPEINERQARELSKLPSQEQAPALQAAQAVAQAENRHMTANDVKEAAAARKPAPEQPVTPQAPPAPSPEPEEEFKPDITKTINDCRLRDALILFGEMPVGYKAEFFKTIFLCELARDMARNILKFLTSVNPTK